MGVRSRSSAGGAQFGLSVTSATVVTLTVPNAAAVATIYVRTAAVVYTRDGTDPTATAGVQADAGDIILLVSRDELDKFEVIAVSATATLDVEYFVDIGGLPELIKSRMRVEGIAAHDAAAAGNPLRMGGVYRTTLPAIAAGDVGDIFVDADGRIQLAHAGAVTLNKDLTLNDSNKTVTVTAGQEWQIMSVHINLNTTATAGNRTINVQIGDGTDAFFEMRFGPQAASTRHYYNLVPGGGQHEVNVGTNIRTSEGPLPDPCWLKAGYTIQILDADGVDAAADDMLITVLYLARDAA